jgi:hypothetical protein
MSGEDPIPSSASATSGADRLVLPEADAVELLAFLVSAARTQIDEAAEYAPMRLLTAAQRLADALDDRASGPVAALIAAIRSLAPTATPSADRAEYTARVDRLCVAVADCLLALDQPTRPS